MRILTLASVLVMAAGLLLASPSHALFMTSDVVYATAHPGDTLIDFEGVAAAGSFSAIAPGFYPDLLLGPAPYIDSASFSDATLPAAPSDYLCSCSYDVALTVDFTSGVDSVGFLVASAERNNAASAGGNVTVNVFSGSDLLDSQTFFASNVDSFDTFAGFDGFSDPITRIEIVPDDPDNFILIDNLRFGTGGSGGGVPEPSAILLCLTGCVGLAWRSRSGRH